MRRAFLLGLVSVFVIGGVIASLGAGESASGKRYEIVFDSAFGLTKGADFKVGGVAVGSIADLDVDRRTARALVTVEASGTGGAFAGLRKSAKCTINPQSLIGEYFVDCQPGKTGALLKSGTRIPVERTTSPIPPDLVLDITRRPIAQRFSILFSQLGVGFAARGGDVNTTLRRAIPALQTTNEVLDVLATKRQTIADLARDGGATLKVLGRRRGDVTDFVEAAGDAATATADRRAALAETFRRFPGFLDQLTPTMRDLGTTSREFTPALQDLRVAAPTVTSLLNTLRPFAKASRPAITSLGTTSKSGREASREARSLVSRLNSLGKASPEPAKNLRIILDHLDDREFAVEPDSDSPGGKGYTGLEAPLQYIFDQTLALNTFDQRGYALRINLSAGECGNYTDAAGAKSDPDKYAKCNQNLGPNQPGITTADPSGTSTRSTRRSRRSTKRRTGTGTGTGTNGSAGSSSRSRPAPTSSAPSAGGTPAPGSAAQPAKPNLGLKPVQDLLDGAANAVPSAPSPAPQATGSAAPGQGANPADDLLDFLLRP